MSHRSRVAVAAFMMSLLLLSSCTARQQGPPTVRWGVDECASCHMILAEERFAAVARNEVGVEGRFDDLGCLLRWNEGRPAGTWKTWVHDAGGRGWLDAEAAFYTRNPTLATPMGSGLRAWTSREAAIGSGDLIGSWQELHAAGSAAKP